MHNARDFLKDATLQTLPVPEHRWVVNLAATPRHPVIALVRTRGSYVRLRDVR